MKFIDTHLHLQDYKQKCATDIIAAASKAAVKKMVCAAVSEADWPQIASLSEKYPEIIVPAFGIHPWHAAAAAPGWAERLSAYLQRFSGALVGESGLDRLHSRDGEPQNQIFRKQIELAVACRRPLIVHAVRAQSWLENYWKCLPEKFVLHSYNGKQELLKQAVKAGGYISFSPAILKHPHAREIVNAVPVERLLLETDGSAHAQTEILPEEIPGLFLQIAALRPENTEELAVQIYQNSLEFIKPW